ncbi:MAG TPA: squalene/phytoene synthase family protein [Solirubrobacteraceae bacterium]
MSAGAAATPGLSVEEANRRCAEVTRVAAANFHYGIRLLPPAKRSAMCAIYAFARRIDDIGDSGLEPAESLRQLDEQQTALAALEGSGALPAEQRGDPVFVALADAYVRCALPLSSLGDLIDGVKMDVAGESYETFDQLVLYCRRVAGSIGRLSLAVFGAHDMRSAALLADDLGVAMQLTNILRDIREDAERGRVYIPSEDLVRYHLHNDGALGPEQIVALAKSASDVEPSVIAGFDGGDLGQLFALMRFQALRANEWFHRGFALLPLLDRRSAACVSAMSGIYRRLLVEIQSHPDAALTARASLPVHWKAWVALGSMLAPHRLPQRHPAERLP